MRWPIEVKLGGRPPPELPPPAPHSSPPEPRSERPAGRPSTFIELFSDLSKDREHAATFVRTVGWILVIATICVVIVIATICVAVVVEAAKGIKGVPFYVLPAGLGGASLVTLITTLLTRWVRRLGKSVRPGPVDAQADRRPGDS